ncbi:YceD family protein [Salipiger sp.]|uniref:YceD family protein n=1 Tax=Salipiger sp. TaxID=2078585 RepID=UPI003A97740C
MADRSGKAGTRYRVAALKSGTPTPFDLRPDAEVCAAIAQDLDLLGLRKLRFAGQIAPEGREGWRIDASLGATVVQACVATLAPVTTRIEEPVARSFLPEERLNEPGDGTEIETPEDDVEALPDVIDLREILTEALSLALPPYPRSPDAPEPEAPPPAADEAGERPNPFAALAGLRDKLAGDDDETP